MYQQTAPSRLCVAAIAAVWFVVSFALSASEVLSVPAASRVEVSKTDGAAAARPKAELPDPATAADGKPTYVGTNQCFTCHRPQTDTWSETKHAHALSTIPKKYQNDPGCLKCHATGFGQASGYVAGTEKDLSMVGCEACHGPGSLHIDAAKRFVLANLGEEAAIEKEMKQTIVKTPADAVCIGCHIMQAHQQHPAFDGQSGAKDQFTSRCVRCCFDYDGSLRADCRVGRALITVQRQDLRGLSL